MNYSSNIEQHPKKEYLVGVNYFAGWWRPLPNKYVINGKDWRLEYPERIPILGCYNDQETMDAEIIAAAEHGVDVFLMLWYVQEPERHAHGIRLNYGIKQFLASPENHKMRFMIEFCNHPPFDIDSDELWEASCKEWIEAMQHPSYLRIGGKAVFKVHGLHYFLQQNQMDSEKVRKRIDVLRKMADDAGVGALLVGAGSMAEGVPDKNVEDFLKTFDFLATYMDVPGLMQETKDYSYDKLMEQAKGGWLRYADHSLLPYMPYVPAGWNPRPWKDPRPSFSFPDARQWKSALEMVKDALDTHPKLRLPDNTKAGQKMFNIYAWNEFAEGGIVAPTLGDGLMKLEGIREIFGGR